MRPGLAGVLLACAAATPAAACSIIFEGYPKLTRGSDAVALVEVLSVEPTKPVGADNPFVPTEYGHAEARVLTQLKGPRLPRTIAIDHWWYDTDKACGSDFTVRVGETYYVWFEKVDGRYVTSLGVNRRDVPLRDRQEIAEAAGR